MGQTVGCVRPTKTRLVPHCSRFRTATLERFCPHHRYHGSQAATGPHLQRAGGEARVHGPAHFGSRLCSVNEGCGNEDGVRAVRVGQARMDGVGGGSRCGQLLADVYVSTTITAPTASLSDSPLDCRLLRLSKGTMKRPPGVEEDRGVSYPLPRERRQPRVTRHAQPTSTP